LRGECCSRRRPIPGQHAAENLEARANNERPSTTTSKCKMATKWRQLRCPHLHRLPRLHMLYLGHGKRRQSVSAGVHLHERTGHLAALGHAQELGEQKNEAKTADINRQLIDPYVPGIVRSDGTRSRASSQCRLADFFPKRRAPLALMRRNFFPKTLRRLQVCQPVLVSKSNL
jgi:hypothetical protein